MLYNHLEKERNLLQLNNYIYAKTLSMFDYTNLPETLPPLEIEKMLQKKGFGFVSKFGDDVFIFDPTFSGEQDAYGNHKKVRVDNVHLKFHKELDLKTDGVLMQNDDLSIGLDPLINRINSLMIENEITMFVDNYNSRIQTLISAGDEPTKESAELYLEKIKKGDIGIIGENHVFDGIKTHNVNAGTQNTTIHLIELNQYLKATLYNELGLSANYNMKRERLNTKEVQMNDDALHPFIDNMLKNRKESVAKINEMFGLNIGVEFGSIWETKKADPVEEIEEVAENVSRETIQPQNGLTIEQLVLNVSPETITVKEEEREELEDITDEEIQEEIEIQEGEENDV